MDRIITEVWTTWGRSASRSMSRPASRASSIPLSLSGTSCQPVKRFSRFQVLCPCRNRTSLPGSLPVAIHLAGHLDDLREFVRLQARATDQAAVAQRKLHIGLNVRRRHAASIKDANLACSAGADELTDDLADQPHGLVRVLRVGVLAAADRPHRLVPDDQA